MKVKDEVLLEQYYNGWELQANDSPFPNNFATWEEKRACLEGYNDFNFGINYTRQELIEKLKNI